MTGIAAIMEIAVVRVVFTVAGRTVTFRVAKRLRLMAVLALILVVHTKERKSSKVVIEKHRVLPLNFCVATSATRSQRPFVCIVVQMTRVTTRQWRYLENRFDVAINTCSFLMSAEKAVLRVTVMVEKRFLPGRTAVAAVALVAVVAIVAVILEMAGDAGRLHLVLEGALGVTVSA